MSYQEIKYRRLIYIQMSIDIEVYLDTVKVITGSQGAKVSEVLEVSL